MNRDLYQFFRSLAFKCDPEQAHGFALASMRVAPRIAVALFPGATRADRRFRVASNGMSWSFPVGVAAGLDKNAVALDYLSRLGFGAIEVGTVTPVAQRGNPRPRVFRYPESESLRNSLGFPNVGPNVVAKRLAKFTGAATIGLNIGKAKVTAEDNTSVDYRIVYEICGPFVDYIVINVSSPNTPGLRSFQAAEALAQILNECKQARQNNDARLFVKVSPDLSEREIVEVFEVSRRFKLDGIVATNTTVIPELGAGGVSGRLLRPAAERVRNQLLEMSAHLDDFEIIGCGGFATFEHLVEFWRRGGHFAQVYTAFVFKGPPLLREVERGIVRTLQETGAGSLQELFDSAYFLRTA